jgi:hypothetical protein
MIDMRDYSRRYGREIELIIGDPLYTITNFTICEILQGWEEHEKAYGIGHTLAAAWEDFLTRLLARQDDAQELQRQLAASPHEAEAE